MSQFRKLQEAISPFKKQKSPVNIMLLRPGLLCASTFASKRQVGMRDPSIHLFSCTGPGTIYCREPLTLYRFFPARHGLCTEVGFVCVSGPVLARGLSSWATGVTWVLLRVS
jgi:hypothetical protein